MAKAVAKTFTQLIHEAIQNRDDATINEYFKHYTDVNLRDPATGFTLVHKAVATNSFRVLDILLVRGASVNVLSNENFTPLHLAVLNQSTKMVEILLNHGAYVNPAFNFRNFTPLYIAVDLNCPIIARMLLSTGASIRRATIGNVTVLELARKTGNQYLCNLLMDYFARQLTWPENCENEPLPKLQLL